MSKQSDKGIIAELQKTVAQQATTIQELLSIITRMADEIAMLKGSLNQNSQNSSKPPSSDGLSKPKPKSLRKASGKKAGGQPGHKGSGLKLLGSPDETIQYRPGVCIGCPNCGSCQGHVCKTRYQIDIKLETHVTAHQALEFACQCQKGEVLRGEFPTGINAPMQYGKSLAALVVVLNTNGMMSENRIHELLRDVFGIPISTGTISAFVKRCADKVSGVVAQIRDKLCDLPIVHFDETGLRVDKKLYWVHSASTSEFTYLQVHAKRGKEGMDSCGVLPKLNGIAVHDCWMPYFRYDGIGHSICCAHLLRELTGVVENTRQPWAQHMIGLLIEMKTVKEKLIAKGKSAMSPYYLKKFAMAYGNLLSEGMAANPIPKTDNKRGRCKKGKVRSLLERLSSYKAYVCLFIHNFHVPFDNNQAERDVRMVKVKQKVSGCFRTKSGADDFATIMSFSATVRKRGLSVFFAIKAALQDFPDFALLSHLTE